MFRYPVDSGSSNSRAISLAATVRLVIEHPFPEQSPRIMCCVTDHKIDARRILQLDGCIQEHSEFYCCWS